MKNPDRLFWESMGERYEEANSRITPGSHPRMLKAMLMMKLESQPVLRKTDNGGRKSARKYSRMSLVDEGGRDILAVRLRLCLS